MAVATTLHALVLAPLFLAPTVQAQVAPPVLTPERIEQLAPAPSPRLAPSLRPAVPEPVTGPGAQARVRIGRVRVTGNLSLTEAEILRVVGPLAGQEVPLAAIEDARIAVISAYGQAGYPFVTASAGLAPGEAGAELTLSIVEGRIAAVRLDSDIGPAGTRVLRFLQPLTTSGTVTNAALERALLLAGDVPGVTIRSVLRPLQGGEAGALELVAQVTRRAFSGYFSADNRGYRLTGPVQGLLTVGANSFTEYGERIEATLFQTQDWEQSLGQVSAEAFVGDSGLRLRGYVGVGRSRPGSFLAQIGYTGNTQLAGVAATYPIVRTRPFNLFAAAQFDMLNSEVLVGDPATRQSLDEVRAVRLGLEASTLDGLLSFAPGAATTTMTVRLHQGVGWFGGSNTQSPLPARVSSDFTFAKISAELSRTQPMVRLADQTVLSLFGQVAGQRSDDVLPTSEKFLFGGNRLGRGFYAGQVTGDTAFGATMELQLDAVLPPVTLPFGETPTELTPSAQFYLFRDFGRTWENLASDTGRTVESWGGGVRLFLTDQVQLDIEGVRRITRRVDAAGSSVPPLADTAGFFRLLTRF